MANYNNPINYLNAYLYFMWNYATIEHFKKMFEQTIYDSDYIFNDVWCEQCNCEPAVFWSYIDTTARQIVFDYIIEFYKDKRL